jgi:hypothetical protein
MQMRAPSKRDSPGMGVVLKAAVGMAVAACRNMLCLSVLWPRGKHVCAGTRPRCAGRAVYVDLCVVACRRRSLPRFPLVAVACRMLHVVCRVSCLLLWSVVRCLLHVACCMLRLLSVVCCVCCSLSRAILHVFSDPGSLALLHVGGCNVFS